MRRLSLSSRSWRRWFASSRHAICGASSANQVRRSRGSCRSSGVVFPTSPSPSSFRPQCSPEQQRRYLFNAVLELFERVSRETPMVLLMDDLHWADESSLLLLEHLAPHLEKLPLLILGTYRDVDLDVQKPFEKTLARLVRQKLAERYAIRRAIRRLAEPDVRDLLAALGGSDPPVALVSAIYRETEGNPFFVTEVFQHLSEEGVLFDDDGEWKSGLDVEALDVPEGVRLVIGRRLERLGEETPKVLTLAAVFGRRFEVRVLEAVEGQDSDVVLDALDESIAAGLVTSITVGREARYEFAHELIRQTLLATLSLPRRQRLHLRVANAFEKVYEARADERAADVARHLYQAGTAAEPTKTIHYLRKAAESALAAAASDEALRFLNMLLSLLEDEPGDGTEKADLLSLRGLAHRGLGRLEDTEADLRGALALYEEGNILTPGVVYYIESRRFLIRDSPRPATTYEQKTGGADGVKGA